MGFPFSPFVRSFFAFILLSACFLPRLWAEDIDIDMGGSSSNVSKNTSSNTKVTSSSAKTSRASDQNPITESPETGSKGLGIVKSIVVESKNDQTFVEIDGDNLSKPTVEKVPNKKKILIKIDKAKLEIPGKLKAVSGVVKGVRSSMHPGQVAWIVLDLESVKQWNISKNEKGYSLVLGGNVTQSESKSTESGPRETSSANVNEKKLFFRLIDLTYKPVEKGIKIVLTSDGPPKYTVRKLSQPEKLVIRFRDTKLEISEKLKNFKNGDNALQLGGLLSIELRQIGPAFSPISEAILTLVPGTVHQLDRDLNQVVITLSAPHSPEKAIAKKGDLNKLVTMEVEAADLTAVLRTLASESGFDVDFPGGPLVGVVNEKFKEVPLKTVLATLLSPGAYGYEVQGNTLRFALQTNLKATKAIMPQVTELISPAGGMSTGTFDTLVRAILNPNNSCTSTMDPTRNLIVLHGTASDIEDYKKTIKDLKLDESGSDERITRIVKLNYADANVIQGILAAYLTPVGKVQLKGQSLVIWESATNMGVLLELIKELDGKPAQVLIESNIVEVDDEKDLNLGINWSASRNIGDPTMNASFNNLPTNAVGNLSAFTFGTIKSGMNISATIEALQTHKKGKIISRPRVATQSGILAEIQTSETAIYESTSTLIVPNAGTQFTTTFNSMPLPIDLKVTPRISDDGRITTVVSATITSVTGPPLVSNGSQSQPPTSTQTVTTTVTTKNGETIVIGGLVRDSITDTVIGIPLLGSLPLIGSLFQSHEKQDKKEELVIFITPTLVED